MLSTLIIFFGNYHNILSYSFTVTFVRVGDSRTSLSSGASAGNEAIFLAYQVMAGFAEIPCAKTLKRTVVLTTTAIVCKPGMSGASLSVMSSRTIDASPRGPNHPIKRTESVFNPVFIQGKCDRKYPDEGETQVLHRG